MAILTPTKIRGTVTWLGLTEDSETDIASIPRESVDLSWAGIAGDCHTGETRSSCVRVRAQYQKGTEIRNVRQISILSEEELAQIAEGLGVPQVRPEWVGANMVVRGIPDFTLVPPNARLIFQGGTSITIDMENAPCQFPAEKIEEAHPGHGKAFPKVALNKRGVTAWVEKPGTLSVGESCQMHVPPQRLYPHL